MGSDEFEVNYCVTSNGQCQLAKVVMNVVNCIFISGATLANDCVWRGHTNQDGVVNNSDILPLGYFMGLDGPTRGNASLERMVSTPATGITPSLAVQ